MIFLGSTAAMPIDYCRIRPTRVLRLPSVLSTSR